MSSFINRLKNLKAGAMNFNINEGDTGSIGSFDEEGFLCPVCRRKFSDTSRLEHHYLQAHAESDAAYNYQDTNGAQSSTKYEETEDPYHETSIWKQQFVSSEESRMQLSSELMQSKQRVGDLEEELELLKKQLQTTQMKVVHQSQEIGNLKATKDVYDAQLAVFTDELLNTQGELKEKQNQVDTLYNDLIPRPTNDDVDVLKRELISVQQRMNEMALEKEQEIVPLRDTLLEIQEYTKKFDQFENIFDQNISSYDEIINNHTSQIKNDINQIKELVHLTHERKDKMLTAIKYMRSCLNENRIEIDELKQKNDELHVDLEHQNEANKQLINDLENEQKQGNSYRNQIEILTNDFNEIEKNFNELKEEKNQLLLNKMEGDEDNERQNVVRQLTQEKDQYEQQIKDFRKQIKQINEEKENLTKQIDYEKNQLQDEQIKFNNEINSLKQQFDEKEKQLNELHENYNKLEIEFQQTKDNHKQEIERIENEFKENKSQLTEEIDLLKKENLDLTESLNQSKLQLETIQNEFKENKSQLTEEIDLLKKENLDLTESLNQSKLQLETIQNEKLDIENQFQTNQQTISELHLQLEEKNNSINRLSNGIRHSINLAHKTYEYIHEKIPSSQNNLLTLIEQSEQELQTIRSQTLEDIRNEFTSYLDVTHSLIIDNKNKFDKQIEEYHLKLVEEQENHQKQLDKITNEHKHLIEKYEEQKEKLENQLGEINNNLLQVSESLSESNQLVDSQKEKFEKQITLLEEELTNTRSDLESRTKKYEMQSSALTENLSTVRTELKMVHEKLIDFEQIKLDKTDLELKLSVNQDERQSLLERSITSENRNEKLLLENGQLAKKISDLEFALQELAREYQGLQIQTNKVSERRWVNDTNIHECMKCTQTFTLTQRKHHCRSCGNVFCDQCSSKTAVVAAASKKPQRVCDQCYRELTS